MDVLCRSSKCIIINSKENILVEAYTNGNVYTFDFIELINENAKCSNALDEDSWLWHKRLGYANFDLISKLSNKRLVCRLSKLKLPREMVYDECKKNKQVKKKFSQRMWYQLLNPCSSYTWIYLVP